MSAAGSTSTVDFDNDCDWPRWLLHVPSMTSFPWSAGNNYGRHKEPLYYAITYTWGRFELQDGVLPEVKPIAIDVPWTIPRIHPSHFTAGEFESLIKGIMTYTQGIPFKPKGVKFVWLDIACIDQTPGSREKDLEVGRQATIFRNAVDVFVWLNKFTPEEIRPWHLKLFDGIEVLYTDREIANGSESRYLAAGEDICEALDKYGEEPWFTSLWTLQEAFLCQDAFLLGKDGQEWCAGLEAGENADPLRLHNLVAILDILHGYTDDSSGWPLLRSLNDRFDLRNKIQRLGVVGITHRVPTALLTVSHYRRVGPKNQEDRVYGIMQVFNLKLGKSDPACPPGAHFSVEELQDQLGTALLEKYPIMSQLFIHEQVPGTGEGWRMGTRSVMRFYDMPYIDPNGSLNTHATGFLSEDDVSTILSTKRINGQLLGHFSGPSCALRILTEAWQSRAKLHFEMTLVYLGLDASNLLNPPSELVVIDETYKITNRGFHLACWLAEAHPSVIVIFLGRTGTTVRKDGHNWAVGLVLLPKSDPHCGQRFYRRVGYLFWGLNPFSSPQERKGLDSSERRCIEGHESVWKHLYGVFG